MLREKIQFKEKTEHKLNLEKKEGGWRFPRGPERLESKAQKDSELGDLCAWFYGNIRKISFFCLGLPPSLFGDQSLISKCLINRGRPHRARKSSYKINLPRTGTAVILFITNLLSVEYFGKCQANLKVVSHIDNPAKEHKGWKRK